VVSTSRIFSRRRNGPVLDQKLPQAVKLSMPSPTRASSDA